MIITVYGIMNADTVMEKKQSVLHLGLKGMGSEQ